MRRRDRFPRLGSVLLLFVAAAIAGTGCTSTYTAPNASRMPDIMAEEKVPLRLGLYMQPQVREHMTEIPHVRLKPGLSLGKGVEDLMRSAFTDVFLLGSLRGAAAAELDAVMTVEILNSDFKLGGVTSSSVYNIQVQYTVTAPGGRLLWSEGIEGTGKKSFGILKREYPDAMRLAIEDNLDKTWQAMKVSQWWKPRPVKGETTGE